MAWYNTGASSTTTFNVAFSLVYTRRGWRVCPPVARIVKGYRNERKVYYYVSVQVPHIHVWLAGSRNPDTGPTPVEICREPLKQARIHYKGPFPVPEGEAAQELLEKGIKEIAEWLMECGRSCPEPPLREFWAGLPQVDVEELREFPHLNKRSWWEGKIVLSGGAVIYPHEAANFARQEPEWKEIPPFNGGRGKVLDVGGGYVVECGSYYLVITESRKGYRVFRCYDRSTPVPVEQWKPPFSGWASWKEIENSRGVIKEDHGFEYYEDVYEEE